MHHLMLTVRPSSAPDRKRPSKPWLAADSSSAMPKIWEAIHSPRCPAVTGRPMTLAILASMLLRSCRRAAMCAMGSCTFGSISPLLPVRKHADGPLEFDAAARCLLTVISRCDAHRQVVRSDLGRAVRAAYGLDRAVAPRQCGTGRCRSRSL